MLNIEIEEDTLAELLDYAMTGMEEIGEYTPTLVKAFKELADKLSVHAYDSEVIKGFAASLEADDYPQIEDDEYDY